MSEINITKEAYKAEAKIRRIRRSATNAVVRAAIEGDKKEVAYVETLTPGVRSVLKAAGLLTEEDFKVEEVSSIDVLMDIETP